MKKSNRVLTRMGARELTVVEVASVGGSLNVTTDVCTIPLPPITLTGSADGDACGHGDFDHGQ